MASEKTPLTNPSSNGQVAMNNLLAKMEGRGYWDIDPKLIARCLIHAQFMGKDKAPRTVVSVGSGLGALELEMERLGVKNIICCDPAPGSFRGCVAFSAPGKKPDYPTVPHLIKAKPELVGEVVVLIPWPNPNHSTYDIEAIYLLEPTSIVMVYGSCGAAGGVDLHKWLEGMNISSSVAGVPHLEKYPNLSKLKYTKIYERQRRSTHSMSKTAQNSLLWLARGQLHVGWKTDKLLQNAPVNEKAASGAEMMNDMLSMFSNAFGLQENPYQNKEAFARRMQAFPLKK